MSRVIKFRAWLDNGKAQDMFFVGDAYGTTHDLDCCRYLADGQPVTLMQFTGLHDVNGVEVYENDIVYVAGLGNAVVRSAYHCGVYYETADDYQSYSDCAAEGDYPVVVGNIYQHPELLK